MFKYEEVLKKGPPDYGRPHMDLRRRAKIFLAFDALVGFDEKIDAKKVLYVPRTELNTEEKAELDRRLRILEGMVPDTRAAREKMLIISVTHFVPCSDPDNDAYKKRGLYQETSGILWKIDTFIRELTVGETRIQLSDISEINADRIFDKDEWEAC